MSRSATSVALAALASLIVALPASATHPRPKGATPLRVPLVPAYAQCTAPNRTHGPPLGFRSCNPPVQASSFLTVGTHDANGAPAESEGYFYMTLLLGSPSLPNDSDVLLKSSISDVRCKTASLGGPCTSANAAGGADYSGELQGKPTIRITDHYNAVPPGGGTDPATLIDIPFPVNTPCVTTSDTTIGSVCSVDTSANAVQPGAVKDNSSRVVVEMTQVQVWDGGSDGNVATTPNTLFAVEGLFVP